MEQKEEKTEKEGGLLDCVRITNKHPDKLDEEGKIDFAHDIIEELSIEEINKFLIKWGYNR